MQTINYGNNAMSPVTAIQNILDKEGVFLLENGIQFIYNSHYVHKGKYIKIIDMHFPISHGKCVYIVAEGTSIAYVIPYYVLMGYCWFKNALDENKYKSTLIYTPRDNIILSVKPPHPGRLSNLTMRLINGGQDEYICDYQKESIKEHFDYFCINTNL